MMAFITHGPCHYVIGVGKDSGHGVKLGKIRNFQKWKNDNNNKFPEWFREA